MYLEEILTNGDGMQQHYFFLFGFILFYTGGNLRVGGKTYKQIVVG